MLLNLSSEKCKFWASTTRSLSNFDGDISKFEAVVYLESIESINDSIANIFRSKFLDADSLRELRLTVTIKDLDKMDRKKEFKQAIKMRGSLTIHGIKKEVEFDGNIYFRPKLVVLDYELFVNPTIWVETSKRPQRLHITHHADQRKCTTVCFGVGVTLSHKICFVYLLHITNFCLKTKKL